jgi:cytidine deaminase
MFELIMLGGFVGAVAKMFKPEQEEVTLKPFNEFIIEGCDVAAAGSMIPCIKQPVNAVLITVAGTKHFGANWMTNQDISVCPRVTLNCVSGEGYEHCIDTCNQEFHAEPAAIDACINAGADTVGSVVYLTGHTRCCQPCQDSMKAAGVRKAICIDNGKEYTF